MLYLLIITLIYKQFLESILLIIYSASGIILSGLLSSMFLYLILWHFFTYFYIYENGIEIRKTTFYPLRIKRDFIPYDKITEVEIRSSSLNLKTLCIFVKNRDPYKLTEYEVIDLQEAKDLLLKFKEERNSN